MIIYWGITGGILEGIDISLVEYEIVYGFFPVEYVTSAQYDGFKVVASKYNTRKLVSESLSII